MNVRDVGAGVMLALLGLAAVAVILGTWAVFLLFVLEVSNRVW